MKRRTALFQPQHTKDQELLLKPPPPPPPKTTRPWSKLPLTFIKHLLRHLQIPDYIRFSSVCHAWHISKKRAQTLPSQRLPWLLLPRHVNEPSITVYSLSEHRTYRIPLPPIKGSECISTVRGWLLFERNSSARPPIHSRFFLNPLRCVLRNLPNNSLVPSIINATAIIDSPSPHNPQGFWVFFAGESSIVSWNPKENAIFKNEIDPSELGVDILDMTAEGEKLYYITDDLDLYEYDPRSDTTEPLIEVLPGDTTTQPLIENEHFLMVAHVGNESQILMAVVVYDMDDTGETAKGVDLVELYTECFGEWVVVEAAEFGDPFLFLSNRGPSFCVTAMEAGGSGRWAFLMPGKEKADSISRAQGLEKLLWVEIDLISSNVTYKGIKRKISRVQRHHRRLFRIPSPEPEEPENPRVRRRLLFPSPEPQEHPSPHTITRPWSKLPLRFVKHLLHRLQIPDYIHFSSVCHAWHISKKCAQTSPAPQRPWFLLPRQTHESVVIFYRPSEKSNYRFSLPSISGYDCVTSIKGWLLFESVTIHSRRFLINPLSKKQHDLPNLPITGFTLPKVTAAAIMVPFSPTEEGIWILIASDNVIIVWDLVSLVQSKMQLNFNVLDMVAMTNNVYIVKENLDLVGYDPQTNDVTNLVLDVPKGELPRPSMENDHFLVCAQALGGLDILMVVVVYSIGWDDKSVGVDRMELYVPCDGVWVRMPPDALGDLVLFLGFRGSSVSTAAAEAGVRARMAYMVPEGERLKSLSNEMGQELKWVEFDLESGKVNYR